MQWQRESILSSSLRTFSRIFFAILALFLGIFLCSVLYTMIHPGALIEEKTTFELIPDADGRLELTPLDAPVILQIPITGVIGDPEGVSGKNMEHILLESRKGFLDKDRVKGILLYFNTPGGTVVDANAIYEQMMEYKERYKVPIFSYVEGLCASGGMYIASSSDKIFAGPAAIVGSVGVILGPFFNFYEAMGKVGMKARTLTEGIDKDMLSPIRPWKEGEDRSLQEIMSFLYNQFVDVVVKGRPRIGRSNLVQRYGAQVFDSVRAEELGYVDQSLSSRNEALSALLHQANIDPKKSYQVVTLSPKRDLLSEVLRGNSPIFTGRISHRIDHLESPIQGQFAYLYRPFDSESP